jgi:hypothetical protein
MPLQFFNRSGTLNLFPSHTLAVVHILTYYYILPVLPNNIIYVLAYYCSTPNCLRTIPTTITEGNLLPCSTVLHLPLISIFEKTFDNGYFPHSFLTHLMYFYFSNTEVLDIHTIHHTNGIIPQHSQ